MLKIYMSVVPICLFRVKEGSAQVVFTISTICAKPSLTLNKHMSTTHMYTLSIRMHTTKDIVDTKVGHKYTKE